MKRWADDKCGVCNFYVGSKTVWGAGDKEYRTGEPAPGCSRREHHRTRFEDDPCDLYERCVVMYGTGA